MRDDRKPVGTHIRVELPTGTVHEMDVWLNGHELKATPGYVLEPWVRVTIGVEWSLAAGVDVAALEDDGA